MTQKIFKPKKATKGRRSNSQGLSQLVDQVTQSTAQKYPKFSAGDEVKVHVRIKEGEKERIQIFNGTVIARKGRGATASFIVRKMSHGVGVERVFVESSPKIAKVQVVTAGKVRRAKLFYLRELQGRAARIDHERLGEGTDGTVPGTPATGAAPTTPSQSN